MPAERGRSARLKLMSGLIVFALAITATEVGLREVVGLGNPILYKADPACGYVMLPGQHLRRFRAVTDINEHGLRGPKFADQKRVGAIRLMFLGDSITYGTTRVDQNDIFAERVRQCLSAQLGRPVEEINASANAWAIGNEAGFLKSRGTFDSDYVISILNSADPAQPFSQLRDVGDGATAKPTSAIGEFVSRYLLHRSHGDAGTATIADRYQETRNLALLSEMAHFARDQQARFAVVYVPFRRDVAANARSSVPPALLGWAHSERVPLIDLTATIAAYPVDRITNPDRTHFDGFGNEIIAKALVPQLASMMKTGIANSQQPVSRPAPFSAMGHGTDQD